MPPSENNNFVFDSIRYILLLRMVSWTLVMTVVFPSDVISLTQTLIRFPSVTPLSAGSLDFMEAVLSSLGFQCYRLPHEDVDNLYARLGATGPNFCFAGHVDVVPVGDLKTWSVDPFEGVVKDGKLFGRGACDMKGGIAAFVMAVKNFLGTVVAQNPSKEGSISFLLTSDEEGPAIHGTRHVIQWLKERGETIDACLLGEPTCHERIGDVVKIGSRGSLNCRLTLHGKAGHVAYHLSARNPVPSMVRLLDKLIHTSIDQGVDGFDPSRLEVTSVDVGNMTTNVIPSSISARLNIRFNPLHSGESLVDFLHQCIDEVESNVEIEHLVAGEPFLCKSPRLQSCISQAVDRVTGIPPQMLTVGGTSDGRFLKDICPVIELGLSNKTAHQADEHILVSDLEVLVMMYEEVLKNYFT